MATIKRVLLYLMAVLYIAAGVMHFVTPDFYVAIMPRALPWHLELVWLSGLAEIAVGVGLMVPRTRIWAAWGTIALLLAVYPANIDMALHDVEVVRDAAGAVERVEGADVGLRNWLRLPIQLVLIAWAWWYTRED